MSETTHRDPTATLTAAHEAYDAAVERVTDHGEADLRAVADAYDRATTLLDKYEDRATGTGDFEGFIEFRESFDALVEGLDDDLPRCEAFETANDRFDKRRLSTGDFAAARDALAPVEELVGVLDDRDAERERYREARRRVANRRDELEREVADLERLSDLAAVDLDSPTGDLREPIEAYNDRVREAFDAFRHEASARQLLEFVGTTRHYPLVSFRPPPTDLRDYVESSPVGAEPLATLTEYADYSASKLDHYVENPDEFRRHVVVNRSYLDGLDAEPLTVSWPPPTAGVLRYRIRELVAVVGRFAPESTVARLRSLRETSETDRYERLRRAAAARESLTQAERTRLAEGTVESDLEAARAERDRLDEALAAHPGP